MTRERIIDNIEKYLQVCDFYQQPKAAYALGYQRALQKIEIKGYNKENFMKAVKVICNYYNESINDVLSMSRETDYMAVRKMYCYIVKEDIQHNSLAQIGKLFGYTHATVSHHHKDIENRISGDYFDKKLLREATEIKKILFKDESK